MSTGGDYGLPAPPGVAGVEPQPVVVLPHQHAQRVDAPDLLRDGRLGGDYSLQLGHRARRLIQQRVTAFYNAQCCGIGPRVPGATTRLLRQRVAVPKDRRFNLGFTLAGIGTFSNFFGNFGGESQRDGGPGARHRRGRIRRPAICCARLDADATGRRLASARHGAAAVAGVTLARGGAAGPRGGRRRARRRPPGGDLPPAGVAHVGDSWAHAEETLAGNVVGTSNLFDALRRAGHAVRVLVTGSATIYQPSADAAHRGLADRAEHALRHQQAGAGDGGAARRGASTASRRGDPLVQPHRPAAVARVRRAGLRPPAGARSKPAWRRR